jgi:hypothetical protein
MFRKYGLLILILGVGLAVAQTSQRVVQDTETLKKILQVSRSELLLTVPSLRQKSVAEAIHNAATQRGAKVFLLVDDRWVAEPASYLGGLSLTKNVHIRLLHGVAQSWAVVDRQVLIRGPMLMDEVSPLNTNATTSSQEKALANRYVRWFTTSWKTARPYRYTLNRN